MDWQARYEVQQTLSESFKGATFQALDRQNGQTVLLRVLYRSTGELYETLKGQSSRYLPRIYGVFPDGEDTIVAEEFLQGDTLQQRLEREPPLTAGEATGLFLAFCLGLREVHALGIIHRDLKPANLFLRAEGGVALIDFDAARRPRRELSRDTVYMGTQGYAPPEQYGFAQTDVRSDIYSLGVVGKELCGGDTGHPLWPVLERCTAFDPAGRYGNMDQVLQALAVRGLYHAGQGAQPLPLVGNPPAKGGKSAMSPGTRRFLIAAPFLLMALVILLVRQPFEVTLGDWVLSKAVYLFLVLYPGCFAVNVRHVRQRLPLLRSKGIWVRAAGVLLYALLYLVLLIALNTLAHSLYSPQAQAILAAG